MSCPTLNLLRRGVSMKFTAFLFVLFSFAGISSAQESDAPIIAEIYLAKPNADGKAGEAAEQFTTTDIPIFCVVRLYAPGVAAVKMDFIAAKVPGVKPESKVVSTSYTTKENEDRVNFTGKPHGFWVAGKYRVDIFIGDKKVRNIEFEIKPSSSEAQKPVVKPSKKPSKRSTSSDRVARQSYARAFM